MILAIFASLPSLSGVTAPTRRLQCPMVSSQRFLPAIEVQFAQPVRVARLVDEELFIVIVFIGLKVGPTTCVEATLVTVYLFQHIVYLANGPLQRQCEGARGALGSWS